MLDLEYVRQTATDNSFVRQRFTITNRNILKEFKSSSIRCRQLPLPGIRPSVCSVKFKKLVIWTKRKFKTGSHFTSFSSLFYLKEMRTTNSLVWSSSYGDSGNIVSSLWSWELKHIIWIMSLNTGHAISKLSLISCSRTNLFGCVNIGTIYECNESSVVILITCCKYHEPCGCFFIFWSGRGDRSMSINHYLVIIWAFSYLMWVNFNGLLSSKIWKNSHTKSGFHRHF